MANIDNMLSVEECLEEFGKRIKDTRISSCMTQNDLAEKSGVSLSTVRRIEVGQTVQFENILYVLKTLKLISKIDFLIPAQKLSPVQILHGEKMKKVYRKPRKMKNKQWNWNERGE